MRPGCKRAVTGVAAAALVAAVLIGTPAPAPAAGPAIMPGFPLRAGNNVMLMWVPFPGATSYNIYRGEKAGGPYQKIGSSPMNNHMDPEVPADKTFYYTVKPIVGGNEGEPSVEVVLKGLEKLDPPKFGGFLITDDNKVSIRWESNPKAAFYNLFRSETEKGDFPLLASVQDIKYTDSNVGLGKTYYYQVTAVSAQNIESPRSPVEVVKVEKRVAAAAAGTVVPRPVKYVDAFDVDETFVLREPKDMDADDAGNFFVIHGFGYVYFVSKDLKVLKEIGKAPEGYKGDWGKAQGIFYDKAAKQLYVAYSDVGEVRVYDLEGKLLRSITVARPDPATTDKLAWAPAPVDCALGADGTLWVVDGNYYQLVGYDKAGKETRRVGLPREQKDRKQGDNNLITPVAITVSPKSGNIFVLEVLMQRLSAYDRAGKFLQFVGGRGGGAGKFILPSGLHADAAGRVYVGDRNLERVQVFDDAGAYQATLTDPRKTNPSDQQRIAPAAMGIAVGAKRVYTANVLRERVQIFELPD